MSGLSLIAPGALALAGLLAPLWVLYLLKIKRARRVVASTWLWQQARRDLMARSPFQKLILQIPLLLQALALLLLALGAAEPASRGEPLLGDHIAVVIDTSASMGTREADGKTRLDLAKEIARARVQALAPGSDALLIDAGREPRVTIPAERDTRRLLAAIDRLEAREVEGDLQAAVALAAGRLKQLGGQKRVFCVTDGHLARAEPIGRAAVPVEVALVGSIADNAAIVRVDVRSGLDPVQKREQLQAFLLVANFGHQPRELFVTMKQRNASDVLASRKLVVAPGEKTPVVLSFYPTAGDYGSGLELALAPNDALPADDVAWARVPPGRRLPVVVAAAGEPSPWLVRALVSDPDAEVRAGKLAEMLPDVPHDAFVIVQGACPPEIPGGELLLVAPPEGECLGAHVEGVLESPRITSWDTADERLRFLSLDGVHVQKARKLRGTSGRQELIRSDRGPLALDVSSSSRSGTLLGFDPGESNWPLKASFVVFTRNLLERARLHRSEGLSGLAHAGEPLRIAVPSELAEVELHEPNGDTRTLPARRGLVVVPEAARPGLYELVWSEPRAGKVLAPVNLASAAESDLGERNLVLEDPEVAVTSPGEVPETRRDFHWLLGLLALVFVLLDVWYFTRRPRVPKLTVKVPRMPERKAA